MNQQFISVNEPEARSVILYSSCWVPNPNCPHQGNGFHFLTALWLSLFSLDQCNRFQIIFQCFSSHLFSKLQAEQSFLKYKLLNESHKVLHDLLPLPLIHSPLLMLSSLAGRPAVPGTWNTLLHMALNMLLFRGGTPPLIPFLEGTLPLIPQDSAKLSPPGSLVSSY